MGHENLLVLEVGNANAGEVLHPNGGQAPSTKKRAAAAEVQQEGLCVLLQADLSEPLEAVDLGG